MAPNAVLLYHLYACMPYLYYLRLTPEGENGGVA
jgi:hypothetical protein